MADSSPAGRDLTGVRDVVGNQINPATEETIASLSTQSSSFAGLAIPESDAVYATYPSSEVEVYTYKLSGVTVAIVTVTFSDSSKETLVSAVKT